MIIAEVTTTYVVSYAVTTAIVMLVMAVRNRMSTMNDSEPEGNENHEPEDEDIRD